MSKARNATSVVRRGVGTFPGGWSRAHLLSGTSHVYRRVQDSHGIPHVLLVLRHRRRHEYSARQQGVHTRVVCRRTLNPAQHRVTGGAPLAADFPVGELAALEEVVDRIR